MSKKLSLERDFTRFLNDPTFPYKVTVCIGDERILCSGVLLAQQSSVLEKKFREDDGVLMFEEMVDVQDSSVALKECLDFLHGADLAFSHKSIDVILKFASWYKVSSLVEEALLWIEEDLDCYFDVVEMFHYLKLSDHLDQVDSEKLKQTLYCFMDSNGSSISHLYTEYNRNQLYPYIIEMNGKRIAELLKKKLFDTVTFFQDWVSFSVENKKFVLDNASLFDFKQIFQKVEDFAAFATSLSEDESLMSNVYMGQLLKIQRDYLTKEQQTEELKSKQIQSKKGNKAQTKSKTQPKIETKKPRSQVANRNIVRAVVKETCNFSQTGQTNYRQPYSEDPNCLYWDSDSELTENTNYETSVWIGNLPTSANRYDLDVVFGIFGSIRSITIRTAQFSNYAFIEYYDAHPAAALVRQSKWDVFAVHGRAVKVAHRR